MAARSTLIPEPEVRWLTPSCSTSFSRPDPLDEAVVAAARDAIEGPRFLDAVRTAVRQLLDADPALAILTAVVSW